MCSIWKWPDMTNLVLGVRSLMASFNRRLDHMANNIFDSANSTPNRDETARDEFTSELMHQQNIHIAWRPARRLSNPHEDQ
jgi:hypothetical protein